MLRWLGWGWIPDGNMTLSLCICPCTEWCDIWGVRSGDDHVLLFIRLVMDPRPKHDTGFVTMSLRGGPESSECEAGRWGC